MGFFVRYIGTNMKMWGISGNGARGRGEGERVSEYALNNFLVFLLLFSINFSVDERSNSNSHAHSNFWGIK
jgi:hypothetical protein